MPLAGSPLLLVCGWGTAKLVLNAAICRAQSPGLVLGVLASTELLPNLPLAAAMMALLLLAKALAASRHTPLAARKWVCFGFSLR